MKTCFYRCSFALMVPPVTLSLCVSLHKAQRGLLRLLQLCVFCTWQQSFSSFCGVGIQYIEVKLKFELSSLFVEENMNYSVTTAIVHMFPSLDSSVGLSGQAVHHIDAD